MRLTLDPIRDRLNPNRRKKAQGRTSQAEPTQPPKPTYNLPAGPPEPIRIQDPAKAAKGPVADATKVVTEVTRNKYVALVLEVLDIAGRAGVGLFSAALAYSTMFAIIPMVLLMAGVVGWLIDDPVQRQQILTQLIGYFPPLADFFSVALEGLVAARGALTIIGIVGLVWGASSFYAGLDEVMRRIFEGGHIRGQFDRRARGLITIFILIVLMSGTIVLSSVWALFNDRIAELAIWRYLVPIVALAIFIVVVMVVYLLVPTAPPSRRAALPPAILAGVGIGALTNFFGVLAPWLIGGLTGLGVIATAFAVLIWLNFSFQMLLYGAAWARLRRDRERDEAAVVSTI